jgi:LacI family transcriptional regulator
MASGLTSETLARILPSNTPLVLINANYDGAHYDTLDVDNFSGAFKMTEHLLSLGHREIRMIRGADGHRDASEREAGFRAALIAAGVVDTDGWIVPGEFTEASGFRAAQQILSQPVRPTAIFAANDSMAVGVLSALREAGVRVPEDVAVVGFDDIPIAEYVSPPLTTVRVSVAALGARAVERLFDSLDSNNGNEHKSEVLPTELTIRRSCGATLFQPLKEAPL